jgi:lipase
MTRRGNLLSETLHGAIRAGMRLAGGQYLRLDAPGPDPERGRTRAGAVELSWLRWPGEGTPLVALHGLNNNAWSWARVAWRLSPRPVLAPSLRGHGRSDTPVTGYSLRETTADLLALLDRLAPGPVDLAGHSWGGKVACHLAATAPERFRSLILCDPVPAAGLNPLLHALPWLVDATLLPERGPFADRAAWRDGARVLPYLVADDATDRRLWAEGFDDAPDGSVRHRLPDAGYRELLGRTFCEDLRPLLARWQGPTLLLRPTLSIAFWPGEAAAFRHAWPRLRARRVAGDHSFVHTNPRDTSREIAAFLDGLPPSRCGDARVVAAG